MSLIHSFFPHLPLVSSFPSHLHVHETCKITRRQLFHVKKRAGEAQGILGVSEKNLKCYLLYSTSTWCGWMYFSPHWDVVAKIISKASGCPSVAMIPLHWGQLSLLFQGNLTQPCGKTWEICFTELMLSPAQCWAALGGIYVYALYAQGDIKGYTAFSGEKKNNCSSQPKLEFRALSVNSTIWKSLQEAQTEFGTQVWSDDNIALNIQEKRFKFAFPEHNPVLPERPFQKAPCMLLEPLPKCWVLRTGCSG